MLITATIHCPNCSEELRPGMIRCRRCGTVCKDSAAVRTVTDSDPFATYDVSDVAMGSRPSTATSLIAKLTGTTPLRDRQAHGLVPKTQQQQATPLQPQPVGSSQFEITMNCECGHPFAVVRHPNGRRTECPQCGRVDGTEPRGPRRSTSLKSQQSGKADQGSKPIAKPVPNMLVDQVESAAPELRTPVTLRRTLGGFKLSGLKRTLERGLGGRGEWLDDFRTAIETLGQSHDERVGEILIPLLSHTNSQTHQLVAAALGDLRQPMAVVPLLKALDHEITGVRNAALRSLGKIGDARVVASLFVRSVRFPDQRLACEQVIVDIGPLAVRHLQPALEQADNELVIRSLALLGRIGGAGVPQLVLPLLGHTDAVVRRTAVEVVGQLGEERLASHVGRLLRDKDAAVRQCVATVLGTLGSQAVVPLLLTAINDSSDAVREQVVFALGERKDPSATPALLSLLETDAPALRSAALEALGNIGDQRAADVIMNLTNDVDRGIRAQAVFALRKLPMKQASERLLQFLQDPEVRVRICAAEALGHQKGMKIVQPLIDAARQDDSPQVREMAIKSLGRFGSPASIRAIEEALHDDFNVQLRAIAVLSELCDASSIPALLAMLKHGKTMIRNHAAQALGAMKHRDAIRPLEELLADRDSLVRHSAARALIELGDTRGESLIQLCKQPYRRRRTMWEKFSTRVESAEILGSSEPQAISPRVVMSVIGTLAAVSVVGFFVHSFLTSAHASLPRGRVSSLLLAADGMTVAAGRNVSGLIEVWNIDSKKIERRLSIEKGSIDAVGLAPTGTKLLAMSSHVARIFDRDQWQNAATHASGIRESCTTPNRQWTATCGGDGSVYIWNLNMGEVARTIRVPSQGLSALAMSDDGELIATGYTSGSVKVWKGSPAEVIAEYNSGTRVAALAFNADTTVLAMADAKNGLMLLDPHRSTTPNILKQSRTIVPLYNRLFFLPTDGRLLALESGRGDILTLTDPLLPQIETIDSLGGNAQLVSLSSDGKRLAMADREETAVWIMDLEKKQITATLDIP